MATRSATAAAWPRLAAALLGVGYLALGILGFVLADGTRLERDPGNTVWIFTVSAVLNITHLVVGVLGLAAAANSAGARLYGWLLLAGFAGLTAYGVLIVVSDRGNDILNLNWPNNILHAATAVAGLLMGVLPTRRRR